MVHQLRDGVLVTGTDPFEPLYDYGPVQTYKEYEGGYMDWGWMPPGASGSPDFVDTRWPEFKPFPLLEALGRSARLARYWAGEAPRRARKAARVLRRGDEEENEWW